MVYGDDAIFAIPDASDRPISVGNGRRVIFADPLEGFNAPKKFSSSDGFLSDLNSPGQRNTLRGALESCLTHDLGAALALESNA